MKKIEIYEVEVARTDGDSFSEWFFDKDEAMKKAKRDFNYLTDSEKKKSTISVIGFELDLPEEYEITTAEQLINDLFNDDVECPQYEGRLVDSCHVFYEVFN